MHCFFRSQEPSSGAFRLDKDIIIDDDDHQENDLLHHSMFVDDASEDDYQRQITPEMPMEMHFGSYGKHRNAKNIQVSKTFQLNYQCIMRIPFLKYLDNEINSVRR